MIEKWLLLTEGDKGLLSFSATGLTNVSPCGERTKFENEDREYERSKGLGSSHLSKHLRIPSEVNYCVCLTVSLI